MADTTTGQDPTTGAAAPDESERPRRASGQQRTARFARELEGIGHRPSRSDRRVVVASAVIMTAGVVVAVVAYATSTAQSDTRDVISSVILGIVGLCLVVTGGAVFVRSSMTEFLRFWMLRLLAEQRGDTDAG